MGDTRAIETKKKKKEKGKVTCVGRAALLLPFVDAHNTIISDLLVKISL